ncbi:hypothetical protein M430DRAFT_259645 [Amorphotheca resinae ATCC 22711]|uniref:Uncharacterized protein n=1 Tax=Amorphotheca resinae ATCC 22711 TaxID=857342 RepID=A0A2T3AZ14_AMORE|nr:hypothetical protein M430DRAFT_259645 [Amorphotheca resinae ATCC 22711]PSS15315.1 hypothetical protein M430DRAFT_259645 [Amorphotheca resinae ATCC 22711]
MKKKEKTNKQTNLHARNTLRSLLLPSFIQGVPGVSFSLLASSSLTFFLCSTRINRKAPLGGTPIPASERASEHGVWGRREHDAKFPFCCRNIWLVIWALSLARAWGGGPLFEGSGMRYIIIPYHTMPWGPLFLLLTLLHRTFSLRGQGKRKIGYLSEYLGYLGSW